MGLQNIFEMAKADRYTADGREELAKAREADVEDRTYNIGEISQKTGLQKTANGWVKPKSGADKERNHGSSSEAPKMTPEQRKKWEDKAANPSETTASLRNQIKAFEKDPVTNPHSKEIVDIYKKELAKRESDPNYRPEKLYDSAPRVLTGDCKVRVKK